MTSPVTVIPATIINIARRRRRFTPHTAQVRSTKTDSAQNATIIPKALARSPTLWQSTFPMWEAWPTGTTA
ncbi:hypothetical protein BDR07DRAFT_1419286 [Suillus spraguei]|nr:hypothetical protein BDR07DRAFT_1419286 [Suillus spraguei]